MVNIRKKIFDRNIEINILAKNKKIIETLQEQLSYYDAFSGKEADVIFFVNDSIIEDRYVFSRNPSIHEEINNGFIAHYTNFNVKFETVDDKLNVTLNIIPSGNVLLSLLKKFNNIEFATREERAGQIFFESALIPALFFDEQLFIVHSSGFSKNGKGVLIGGSGGSGKTSLELELCINRNFTFFNDDIAVVSRNGEIFPNLAHPKIYGYNVRNFGKLKEALFINKGIFDKLHWKLKLILQGSDKTRRRLYVNSFNYSKTKVSLKYYFLLFKEKRKDIVLEKTTAEIAAKNHLDIIFTEYFEFINHIRWHEFNSRSRARAPIISLPEITRKWEKLALNVFAQTKNYIIRIPFEIEHGEFLNRAAKIIEETIGV